MARVFVSHASADLALAREVHRWLVDDGHEVFLDHDLRDGIAIGDQWEPRLHERLRWADAMVCLLTAAYVRSTWCAAEVGIARSRGSRLVPVQAEPGVRHPPARIGAGSGYFAGRRRRPVGADRGVAAARRCGRRRLAG